MPELQQARCAQGEGSLRVDTHARRLQCVQQVAFHPGAVGFAEGDEEVVEMLGLRHVTRTCAESGIALPTQIRAGSTSQTQLISSLRLSLPQRSTDATVDIRHST